MTKQYKSNDELTAMSREDRLDYVEKEYYDAQKRGEHVQLPWEKRSGALPLGGQPARQSAQTDRPVKRRMSIVVPELPWLKDKGNEGTS